MSTNNSGDVSAAFEILLEEIEAEIDFINKSGIAAIQTREYDKVRGACETGERFMSFWDRVAALHNEWCRLYAEVTHGEHEGADSAPPGLARLRPGQRTPGVHYYGPILQTLTEMGGAGSVSEVLEKVEAIMRPILRDVDYEPLRSDPSCPRWRNTAQWARYAMVREAMLKADSPRGVWEISERGKRFLEPE